MTDKQQNGNFDYFMIHFELDRLFVLNWQTSFRQIINVGLVIFTFKNKKINQWHDNP
jgi:hypothetical protein